MKPRAASPAASRGVSLIELLMTLSVLFIVGAITLPAFGKLVARNQVVAAGNELIASLQFARHEAVRSNGTVQVCGSRDGRACASDGWRQWIVRSGSGTVLRVGSVPPAVQAHAEGVFEGGVQFDAAGLFHGRGNHARQGRLVLCSARTDHRLELLASGGVRLKLATGGQGRCA